MSSTPVGSDDTTPRCCQSPFPTPGVYSFAGKDEPIVVVGLASRGDVRVIREDGRIDSLPEYRVRLQRRTAA